MFILMVHANPTIQNVFIQMHRLLSLSQMSLFLRLSLFLSLFETAKFGKFGSKDDGSGFKAALLSGPPGVGKTTTAALVCEVSSVSLINTYSITFSLTVFQKQSV